MLGRPVGVGERIPVIALALVPTMALQLLALDGDGGVADIHRSSSGGW